MRLTQLCLATALAASQLATGCSDKPQPAIDGGTPDDVAPPAFIPSEPEPFAGLTGDLEIRIDQYGFPHVYGATDEDTYYGGGYVSARNRLFQMEMLRLRAHGHWASVAGASHLEDDRLSRLLRFRNSGQRDALLLRDRGGEAWDLLVAWTAGINHYIEEIREGQAPLPYGFGPEQYDYDPPLWTPEDVVIVSRMAFFSATSTLEAEILASLVARYFPDAWNAIDLIRPMHGNTIVPEPELPTATGLPPSRHHTPEGLEFTADPEVVADAIRKLGRLFDPLRIVGSNNFAVAGEHTINGRPLIANDPHLMLDTPNVFFGLHLNSKDQGGSFNAAGFTLAGSMGVSAGRNDRLAWSMTTAFGDVMDLFDIRVADGIAHVGGQEIEIVRHEETIRVRGEGQAAGEGDERTTIVEEVPGFGVLLPTNLVALPLVSRGRRVLLMYTGFTPRDTSDALLDMQRATTLDEFDEAISGATTLGFNFIAATAEGITYRVGLDVPNRGAPSAMQTPYLVMNGDAPSAPWQGEMLPLDMLPSSRATERGFLYSANNDPFGFTQDGDIHNDPWYYGALFAPGLRAKRIEEELVRLTARGLITREDMRTLQTDTQSQFAEYLRPTVVEALTAAESDPALSGLLDEDGQRVARLLTEEWDGRMVRESAGALAFRAFLFELSRAVLSDDIPGIFDEAAQIPMGSLFMLKLGAMAAANAFEDSELLMQEGRYTIVLGALQTTADFLTTRFGSSDPASYRYSDLFAALFTHDVGGRLDVGRIPVDGSEGSVSNFLCGFATEGDDAAAWDCQFGPVMRIINSFTEEGLPETWVSMPLGNHGDPASPHFDDRMQDWVEGELQPLPFTRVEVEAATEETLTIMAADSAWP